MQRVIEQLNDENGALQVALTMPLPLSPGWKPETNVLAILAEFHLHPICRALDTGAITPVAGILAEEAGEC